MGLPADGAALVDALAAFVEWDPLDTNLTGAAAEAVALVRARVRNGARDTAQADVWEASIPDSIGARACTEVAAELFYRRSARHGLVNLGGEDGMAPARIGRDPMALAWPLLLPFLGMGVGG